MAAGTIKQGNKSFSYEAYFKDDVKKWYGLAWGSRSHKTKSTYQTYTEAIQAIKTWIKQELDKE